MRSTGLVGAIALGSVFAVLGTVACNIESAGPPPAAPITTVMVDAGAPPPASVGSVAPPMTAIDAGSIVSPPTARSGATDLTPSTGATPDFYACKVDAECAAVPKVGCCPIGDKEAVNKSFTDAYKASFVCDKPNQMCPHIRKLDTRQAECSAATKKCEMVAIDLIKCGGVGDNIHSCPDGYKCRQMAPGMAGNCNK